MPSRQLWAKAEEGAYYSLGGVRGVRFGTAELAPAEPPSSTIVDSGTTFMYLNSAAFRSLLAMLRAARCEGMRPAVAPADEFCVTVSADDAPRLLDRCFAPVSVQLPDGELSGS